MKLYDIIYADPPYLIGNAVYNESSNWTEITEQELINLFEELNKNISTTLELIENVTTASKEQSVGMVQINDAVNNLDQITQRNAQSASEANEIAKQTLKISNEIIEQVNSKEFDGK